MGKGYTQPPTPTCPRTKEAGQSIRQRESQDCCQEVLWVGKRNCTNSASSPTTVCRLSAPLEQYTPPNRAATTTPVFETPGSEHPGTHRTNQNCGVEINVFVKPGFPARCSCVDMLKPSPTQITFWGVLGKVGKCPASSSLCLLAYAEFRMDLLAVGGVG